jgi:large repetitive protein
MEQTITSDGVKGAIVLPASPAGDAIWDFELVLSEGLTPVQEFGQPILVKDATGAVVAIVPQGLAIDSKGAKTIVEEVLRQAKGKRWVVSFAVDVAWLDDSARGYPVMVDPSVQLGAGGAYNKYLVGTQYGTQLSYYVTVQVGPPLSARGLVRWCCGWSAR